MEGGVGNNGGLTEGVERIEGGAEIEGPDTS